MKNIKTNNRFNNLIAFLLAVLFSFTVFSFGGRENMAASAEESTAITIVAASDFQQGSVAGGKANMTAILNAMKNDGFTSADGFFFCGDYDRDTLQNTDANKAGVDGVLEIAETVALAPLENTVIIQGNHDCAIGTLGMTKSGKNDPTSNAYGVYVINEDDYMWKNNDKGRIEQTTAALKAYLNNKISEGFNKPIFILSHLPLHYSMRTKNDGDAQYAKYLFDVLNDASKMGLNIFYLFGHDHNNGWDDYMGGSSVYLSKGDTILIGQNSNSVFKEEELRFTYLNAGYVGYFTTPNSKVGAVDTALTMTRFTIDGNSVIIKRYDKNGLHNLKSAGVRNEAKNEYDYNPNAKVYSSPQTVALTNVSKIKYNDKGTINYSFDSDDNIVLTFQPNRNCLLRSFKINGQELIKQINADTFVIRAPFETYPDGFEVESVFDDLKRYTVTYEEIPTEQGSYMDKAFYCIEGNTLKVRLKVNDGCNVVSVKYGDEEMTYNAESGAYEIMPTASGKVVATIEVEPKQSSGKNSSKGENSSKEEQKGCSGNIATSEGMILMLIVVGICIPLVLRKKRS